MYALSVVAGLVLMYVGNRLIDNESSEFTGVVVGALGTYLTIFPLLLAVM